jgi:hypothetical protein
MKGVDLKIIYVTSCKICPYSSFASRYCFHGGVNQSNDRNLIYDPEKISVWCPLETVQPDNKEQPSKYLCDTCLRAPKCQYYNDGNRVNKCTFYTTILSPI